MNRHLSLLRLSAIASLVVGLAPLARPDTVTYDIHALIDGRDLLCIQAGTLQWYHLDYAAVGRWGGDNYPTYITSTLNGNIVMGNYPWLPTWPAQPPDEIRYPAWSDAFTGLTPALPQGGIATVNLDAVTARDSLTIYQMPTAANNYTLILDFNDDPTWYAAWYEAKVTIVYSTPPAGSILSITGVGNSGLTSTSCAISWTTSVPSTGSVDYGTSASYGSTVAGAAGVTSHSVTLNGLTPGTLYHYRVRSAAGGQTANSPDYTFVTAPNGGGGTYTDGFLTISATRTRQQYTLTVTISNDTGLEFGTSWFDVYLDSASFGGAATTTQTPTLVAWFLTHGDSPNRFNNTSTPFQLSFPLSAGKSGATVPLSVTGHFYVHFLGDQFTPYWDTIYVKLP